MLSQEHTYDVDDAYALPDLLAVNRVAEISEVAERTLEATYFDTADRRLAAADVTLGRRTGGGDDGWHLGLPSAIESPARHVLRIGLGRAVRTVPKRLRSTVAGLTGSQPLSARASVTTRRTLRQLLDGHGVVLAEVSDDTMEAVLVNVGERDDTDVVTPEPTVWRQIEVRLVNGDAGVLTDLGTLLGSSGARRTAPRSKLGDLLGGPTLHPIAPASPEDEVAVLVQHRLATQLDELRRRDPLAREDLPEGVHTMRVAVRRLRSALRTCRPFLIRSVTDPLRDELSWLSDALGEVRDAEVRRSRLDVAIDELVEERPDIDWDEDRVRPLLWSSLADRHSRALTALAEVLVSERYDALLDQLRQLVDDPPWTDLAHMSVAGAYRPRVEREVRELSLRMEAADHSSLTPEERAHALHEARKATKRARYAVEPLLPFYGTTAEMLRTRLKKLQSELGEHQDTVVTRRHLLDLSHSGSPVLDPGAALLAGALVERESLAARRYEVRAAKAWHTVAASSLPW